MNVDESKYKILMDLYRSTKPMAIDKSEALSFLIEERYVKKVRNHGDYDESYTNGHEDQYTLTNQGKIFIDTIGSTSLCPQESSKVLFTQLLCDWNFDNRINSFPILIKQNDKLLYRI
ncbi:hypothetical protein [Oenococcus oeni]|nr:hypothetical protein [Oenococcus oeni]